MCGDISGTMRGGDKPRRSVSPTFAHDRRGKLPSTLAENPARPTGSGGAVLYPTLPRFPTPGRSPRPPSAV